jgi:hypothetical protein
MNGDLSHDLQERFEIGVLKLIEREQRINLWRGRINGAKISPAIYKAVRQRLIELADLPGRACPTRREGAIYLKVGEAERVLRVLRSPQGGLEVSVAVDVVIPAEKGEGLAASSCSWWLIKLIDIIISRFCCGGHCANGAYHIKCAPGSVLIA